jgi:hypothetical protein
MNSRRKEIHSHGPEESRESFGFRNSFQILNESEGETQPWRVVPENNWDWREPLARDFARYVHCDDRAFDCDQCRIEEFDRSPK